ncbi:MAG: long-chain fatty acid--CoA ligase [Paludibacteraceae bacterium]|nr:long-chain fatty acid--CoA ligase [Paludibacteraceae bacterium]MBN2787122.1 long-chain fatty acid--CoA ligase [Paludibacteraceae bacterium]
MMEVKRIFDLVPYYLENSPKQEAAFGYKKNGEWKKISIQEYATKINNISYGFLKLGIEKGDKIAIISGNRPEWNILDMAAMQIGAISVPIYPTISQDDYRYIFNHAEVKLVFIEGKELRTKIEPILPQIKSLQHVYTFIDQGVFPFFEQLEALGKANHNLEKVEGLKAGINENNMATIIYTSGTTGNPKGVMLSHSNFVNNFKSVSHIPAEWCRTALSFLPLCHVYERMLVYLYQYRGISVYYAESIATIADNIKEINPTIMTCVPRLLEKIYDKLYDAGKKQPFFKKKLYYWAFNLAKKYKIEGNTSLYNLQHRIADKLIYSKWKDAIGGNFDLVVSGGSAIQPHMASFFSAIGMPVFEGYGLTESSPVIAVSDKGKNQRKAGTVGPPLKGVEIKIAENNEICCRGHNVMLGYYKEPERTAEVIDKEGWLHTGDMGIITPEGLLKITGRIKSIFKTSFGKYINPQKIEEKCCESPFIENMLVLGENQKFAAALILPDFHFLQTYCKNHKIPYTTPSEIVDNKDIIDRYKRELKKYNHNFGDWEQVKKFKLIADEWSQQTGILTPTLKLKRNLIQEMYKDVIEQLFL